eukprot:8254903-Lingulodinium_polyedra.AAC.1
MGGNRCPSDDQLRMGKALPQGGRQRPQQSPARLRSRQGTRWQRREDHQQRGARGLKCPAGN